MLHEDQDVAEKILQTKDPGEIAEIEIEGYHREIPYEYFGEFLFEAAAHQFQRQFKFEGIAVGHG